MAPRTPAKTSTKKTTPKKISGEKAPVEKAPKEARTKGLTDTFSVIETGGKQYLVSVGNVIRIEKIKGDHAEGAALRFENVLLKVEGSKVDIGTPTVKGCVVEGKLLSEGRAKKVTVIRYKQKSRYFKKNGHRQPYFEVMITKIS